MDLDKPVDSHQGTDALLHSLRELIQVARRKALRAVDAVQVQTCWEIGRHIVEFEQGGAARAEYGTRLLPILAESLSREFGRGFDVTNLRHMRVFYQAFPIRDALRPELSWTHYRTLLNVEQEPARFWYMKEAATQGWTTRALERQINTLYYERLLATSDRPAVAQEAVEAIASLQTPRDFVRDPVMLEFLGLGPGPVLSLGLFGRICFSSRLAAFAENFSGVERDAETARLAELVGDVDVLLYATLRSKLQAGPSSFPV